MAIPYQEHALHQILQEDTSWAGETRSAVLCPACGGDYLHVMEANEVPYERGSMVKLSFWGECDHTFDIIFVTHKGQLSAYYSNVRKEDPQ